MALTLQVFAGLIIANSVLAQPDPCANYQDINEPLRSVGYVANNLDYDHFICDRLLAQGWYRFTSAAGGQMPTTCQDTFHCGTHSPLWMHGTHPTTKAQGVVTNEVCGHTPSGGCCGYKDTVQVMNCGNFFIYNLKPTRGCSFGYCAGTAKPCPPDKWSPSGFEPGCIDSYPKMTQSPILSNPIVKPNTFEFNCHINFDPTRTDVGFDVQWLFDGKPDPNIPRSHTTQRDSTIDQKFLLGHLGEALSCKVDDYFLTSPGRKGPGIPSNDYWMGIKLSEPRLVVGEHEKAKEVKLISTIPIVCDNSSARSCHLEVYLEPNNHDFKTTTSCTVQLKPTDWNPATNEAVTKFEVLAERDFKNDKDKNLLLHFSQIFSVDSPPVFNGYQIPYLQVLTKDKQTSMCQCTGDPHCTTLDRHAAHSHHRVFSYYKIGEFVMYKSTSRPFEVQVRTWQCGHVSCNCAVVAREGNDVVRLDMCHGSYGHTFPKLTIPNKSTFSQGTVVQKNPHGTRWVISFPSGAQVTITNSRNRALNVYITAPEDDFAATQGLCGTFDGRIDNDLTSPEGHIYPWSSHPKTFVDSWRVPIGSSMFDKPPQPDAKLNNDMYFCNCNQAKKQVDCRLDNKAARPALHTRCPGCAVIVPTKTGHTGRRKRLAGTANLTDDGPINYFFDYGLLWTPVITNFPTPSGQTLASATKLCTDAMQQSGTIRQCVARAGFSYSTEVESCIEDIKLLDSTELVHSYVDAAILSCQEMVLKDLSFYNNATGAAPEFITTDLCPSDCSGRGTCVQGTCNCSHGYTGDDCLVNGLTPPTLYNIISTSHRNKDSNNCDIQQRPCQNIMVVGENINRQPGKCHLEELGFHNGHFTSSGKTFDIAFEYDTVNSVQCPMPAASQVGGKTVVGYNISLSNGGHHYSNEIQAFIIDSVCMSCTEEGGACTIKPNTCLIDGQCRTANERKRGDTTRSCKPNVSSDQWTLTVHTTARPAHHTTRHVQITTPTSHPAHHSTGHVQITTATARPVHHTTGHAHITTPTAPPAQHTTGHAQITTRSPAPTGGRPVARFDIWTLKRTGCSCNFNKSRTDCACCDVDACQCPASNQHQCVQCGHTANCGTPLAAPNNGVDGYTLALADCRCDFDHSRSDCACCQNNACQCDERHRNQCVKCGQMGQCGNKPWIFGPAFAKTK